MSSNHTRDLTAIKVGNSARTFTRYSEESVTRRRTESSGRSLTDPGKPEEIRSVLPLEGNVGQHPRMETQNKRIQTKRFKRKSESETSHNPEHRAPQADHTVIRNGKMLSNNKEEASKRVKEYVVCKSTIDGNHFNEEGKTVGKKNTQEPSSQKTVSGAKHETILKDGGWGTEVKTMKIKTVSRTASVDNRKDQRTKIPVSQNSKPFTSNEENESFNAKRTSSPRSSETGNLNTSVKTLEKTETRLSDEYTSCKLTSSHILQKKSSSNKSVTRHRSETGGPTAGSSQVLAASAARKLRQRKGSQIEGDTETRAVRENNPNVSAGHKNGVLVDENHVSESRQTSSESKTGRHSKEDSQERPRSNIINTRKLSQVAIYTSSYL